MTNAESTEQKEFVMAYQNSKCKRCVWRMGDSTFIFCLRSSPIQGSIASFSAIDYKVAIKCSLYNYYRYSPYHSTKEK